MTKEGLEWMMLTNGQVWQAYHATMKPGEPVAVDLFLEVDLLDSQTPLNSRLDKLYYLSKESFKRGAISELWRQTTATSPKALASVVLSEGVLDKIRVELRHRGSHNVPVEDLDRLMKTTVLRPDVLP